MLAIEVIVLILAIIGVVLNNRMIILCFPIWMISNVLAGYVHAAGGMYGMLTRDAAFFVLCIHGWASWYRKGSD